MVENKQMQKILEEILLLKVIDYSCSLVVVEKNKTQKEKSKEENDPKERNNLDTRVKIIPEKSKEKDIVRILDNNEEKIKDKVKDDFLQIAVKMDGFDKAFLDQYQKMLDSYKRFLDEYLGNNANSVFKANYDYAANDSSKKEFQWGDDVVNNLEMFDVARKIMMNAAMGGAGLSAASAGNNTVSHYQREDYEMWKTMSKFNMLLSFLLYEKVMNGG